MPQRHESNNPKWHLLYIVLAAFSLGTVSVSVSHEWAERLGRCSKLGELAAATNGPGNDVFDTRNVPREAARVRSN